MNSPYDASAPEGSQHEQVEELRQILHDAVESLSNLALRNAENSQGIPISKARFRVLFDEIIESGDLNLALKLADLPENMEQVEQLRQKIAEAVTPESQLALDLLIELVDYGHDGPWIWESMLLQAIEEKNPTFQLRLDIPPDVLPWSSLSHFNCKRFLDLAIQELIRESQGAEVAGFQNADLPAMTLMTQWMGGLVPLVYPDKAARWRFLAALIEEMGPIPQDEQYRITEPVTAWPPPDKDDIEEIIKLFIGLEWSHVLELDYFQEILETWARNAGLDYHELCEE